MCPAYRILAEVLFIEWFLILQKKTSTPSLFNVTQERILSSTLPSLFPSLFPDDVLIEATLSSRIFGVVMCAIHR